MITLFIQLDLSGILWMIWNLVFGSIFGTAGLIFLLVGAIMAKIEQRPWRDTKGMMIGKPLLIAGIINFAFLGLSVLLEHQKPLMKALDAGAPLLAIMEMILVVYWIAILFRRKRIRGSEE